MLRSETTRNGATVGALLQHWRRARHLSQLDLAHRADVSARHVCFLETGRAKPSRDMVLLLANTLDVPLREQNALLLAAGFAPMFEQSQLDAPALATVRTALDAILRQQEPFPAVVMDRHWDIVTGNAAASRFFGYMLDRSSRPPGANIIRLMFDPTALRPCVRNWNAVAVALFHRIRRESVCGICDDATTKLIEDVLDYPGVRALLREVDVGRPAIPIIPIAFSKKLGEPVFNFFSTVTTLGTPQDVTLQELRIECFFPTDAATERQARALGAADQSGSSASRVPAARSVEPDGCTQPHAGARV
jgi:transcriptional regulator with XRE-family HTH domain